MPDSPPSSSLFSPNALLRAALEQSPEMVQQRLKVAYATERQREAGSSRLPQLELTVQAVKMTPFIEEIIIRPGMSTDISIPSSDSFSTGEYVPPANIMLFEGIPGQYITSAGKFTQPLYTSGKIRSGVLLASLSRRLEEHLLSEKGVQTAYAMRQLVLGLYMADASLELLATMKGEMETILKDTEAMRSRGLVTEADVLEVVASVALFDEETANTSAQRVQMLEAVRLLTGMSSDVSIGVSGDLESIPLPSFPSESALLIEALERRVELKTRATQVSLTAANISLERADLPGRPMLGLQIEGGFRGSAWPLFDTNWTMDWDHYYQAALGFQMNVFDGGATRSRVRQAKVQNTQASLGEEQTRAAIVADVREWSARLEHRRRGFIRSEADLAASSERLRVSESSYRNEVLGRPEYLEDRLKFNEARSNRLYALFELHFAALELERAVGRLPCRPEEVAELGTSQGGAEPPLELEKEARP